MLSVFIQRTPKGPIDDDDEAAHHGDAEHDAMIVASLGSSRNVGSKTLRLQVLISPTCDLSNDTGVPRAARGGER